MMRDLIRAIAGQFIKSGYHLAPLNMTKSTCIISAPAVEASDEKTNQIDHVKFDMYELLQSLGYAANDELSRRSTGETQRSFVRGDMLAIVNTLPSEKFDFTVTVKHVPVKLTALAAEKKRISYRLPRLKRGSLGTGEYSVHIGNAEIGKIKCANDDHDVNEKNWHVELYGGFDHLAYPDHDKYDAEFEEPHVVYNGEKDSLSLFSGKGMTVQQSRHWINSVFDRSMWESGLIPY